MLNRLKRRLSRSVNIPKLGYQHYIGISQRVRCWKKCKGRQEKWWGNVVYDGLALTEGITIHVTDDFHSSSSKVDKLSTFRQFSRCIVSSSSQGYHTSARKPRQATRGTLNRLKVESPTFTLSPDQLVSFSSVRVGNSSWGGPYGRNRWSSGQTYREEDVI